MQTKHFRLLPLLAAGLLSCQDQASNTTAPTEPGSVALTARLTTATGDSIPAVDSIRFKVKVGQKDTDLVVPWTAHKLDLGTAKLGDSIHWQATGWKWNEAKTQRSIVWATLAHDTLVGVGGTKTTFTLATPISGQSYALPALTTTAFTVGTLDTVAVPSGTGSFPFAFTVPVTDSVWINDTLQVGTAGSFSKNVTIAAGTSVPVKVVLKDALGAITIRTFTLKRPAATTTTTVDSGSVVAFSNPGATEWSLPNGTSTLNVVLQATPITSSLEVDAVMLNGKPMTWNATNGNWTLMVTGIAVGTDTILTATPYVGGVEGTSSSVTVRQLASGEKDSGSTATFTTPAVARVLIGNGITFQDVEVRTAVNDSTLKVDSVLLNGVSMISTDKVHWTGQVNGLPVAQDYSVTATPYVGRRKGTEASVIFRQKGAMPAVPQFSVNAGAYTVSQSVTITCSTSNSVVQWSTDSAVWNTSSTATVDVPLTLYARAFGVGLDTSYAKATYVIAAKEPSFSVGSGTFDASQSVEIVKGDTRATVRYSTDGGATWKTYTGAIAVNKSTILWAYDSVPTLANSVIVRDTVNIRAVAPTFSIKGGTYDSILSVTISSASVDSGAKIECSFDSTATNWTACASGATVTVGASEALYARATGGGYASSKVSSAAYLLKVRTPTITESLNINDSIFASTGTPEAGFEFSRDSSVWVVAPSRYSVATSGPLYVRATRSGWITSAAVKLNVSLPSSGTFKDVRDNQSYNWVRIGAQVWMAQNLNYVVDSSWCYGGQSINCYQFGRLYAWNAAVGLTPSYLSVQANLSGNTQGACPKGWHLPRAAEWLRLTDTSMAAATAGTKLKAGTPTNDTTWKSSGVSGTDAVGFSALPGGQRTSLPLMTSMGIQGFFWTTEEASATKATVRYLQYDLQTVEMAPIGKVFGFSVRCLLD